MKHAYLIVAHHEFEILQYLILALDDERNDIFIHFDKKVENTPALRVDESRLFVINERINVHWGHVSQIRAEYALMKAAAEMDCYLYYHIISGVHMPLYSQDYIHIFFSQANNLQLFMPMETNPIEIEGKMMRYNFFMSNFSKSRIHQMLWAKVIRLQQILKIQRYSRLKFRKASNWVSITNEAIRYLLSVREQVLDKYKYTMCGDEFFIPTELENSIFENSIKYEDRLLKFEIQRASSATFKLEDFAELISSRCLFARKFSLEHIEVVNKIMEVIRDRK